jgi:capsular polysaccharide biosynthesis protein
VPDWTIRLLTKFTGFRPENALRYDADTEYLACGTLAVPTFGHGSGSYFFHSFVREFYARFTRPDPEPRTRRICLSRRNFEQQTRGVLKGFTQRVYMEQAARARGFEIICPEELSFDEQVELFSKVGLVAGEFGSGLHNTLFSSARTIVGSVRYPNAVQTRIAGLMGQDCVYLIPDEEHVDERGAEIYGVAEVKIDRFLDQLVALHEESLIFASHATRHRMPEDHAAHATTRGAARASWRSAV